MDNAVFIKPPAGVESASYVVKTETGMLTIQDTSHVTVGSRVSLDNRRRIQRAHCTGCFGNISHNAPRPVGDVKFARDKDCDVTAWTVSKATENPSLHCQEDLSSATHCLGNTRAINRAKRQSRTLKGGASFARPAEKLISLPVSFKSLTHIFSQLLFLLCSCCSSVRFLLSQTYKPSQHVSAKFHVILFVFSVLFLCSNQANGQAWVAPPENTAQNLGTDVQLTCGLSNLNGKIIHWSQFHSNNTLIENLFINDIRWTDNPRYTVHAHSSTPGVDGYDLRVANLEQFDDKVYRCDVLDVGYKEATITVLVPPGVPAIDIENENDLEEGDNVTLTCSTSGGNPTPTITWFRNNAPISGAQQAPSEKFGTATSIVFWLMTKDDNGAVFKCQVENEAASAPLQISRQISVKYKPVIDFGPYNPVVVVQLEPVTLHCGVDANPTVDSLDIEWLDSNGLLIHTGSNYEIGQVTAADAGVYTCRATNSVGTSTDDFILDVHYAPVVSIQYSEGSLDDDDALRVNEGERLNLTCSIDANPPVDPSTITWKKDGSLVHTGPWIYLGTVQRSDTGTYHCEGYNTLNPSEGAEQPQTGSADLLIRVQYEPGQATISVPERTIKGETVILTCRMDIPGFPSATLTWTQLGSPTIIGSGSELVFDPLRLEDAGDYVCTPSNDVGDGIPDTAHVEVLEYSEFLDGGIQGATDHSINDRGVSLSCSVQGNPEPAITWYKDGQRIITGTGYFHTTEYAGSRNTTSVLHWQGSNRSPYEDSLLTTDTGMYRCEAQNDIDPNSIQDTVMMSVYYAPVLNTTSEKVAIDMDQSGVMHCRGHSLPSTIFTWQNGTTNITSGGRIRITDTYTPGIDYPYESILNISDIATSDFGTYTCLGSNNQGSNSLQIQLTAKTVPESPSDLETLEVTWESVELTWKPGFDGGYAQEFVITYYHSGTAADQIPVGSVTRYNVTHLYPDLNYTFRVVGQNALGTGSPSNAVATETQNFEIEPLEEVTYDENTHTVTFDVQSSDYCARIDIHDGNDWFNYLPCAPANTGHVKIDSNQKVDRLRVSLCLQTRPDVCSEPTLAEIVEQEEDLPTYVVIIIGVICAVIVIALTVVLIILCYKRRQSIKKYEEETKAPTSASLPPDNRMTSSQLADSQLKAPKAYDNPAHVENSIRGPNYDDRKSPVFTTQTSQFENQDYYQKANGNGYLPNGGTSYAYENQSNLHRERSFKGSSSAHDAPDGNSYPMSDGNSYMMNPASRNNSSSVEKPTLYLDDPYRSVKDVHNNSGDGSMGSDQNKPKKVMYEVVV